MKPNPCHIRTIDPVISPLKVNSFLSAKTVAVMVGLAILFGSALTWLGCYGFGLSICQANKTIESVNSAPQEILKNNLDTAPTAQIIPSPAHEFANNSSLPLIELTVELRQIEEGSSGAGNSSWSTSQRDQLLTPQRIQVRNGSKASMSLGQSVPVQWVQSVSGFTSSQSSTGGDTSTTVGTTTSTAKGGSAQGSSKGGSVTQGLMMIDTGQRLVVHPTWGGGAQAVVVEVEVQSARLDTRPGAELPSQSRSELMTTVSAPVGHWVTIASTGASAARGSYGSEGAETSRKLLQLRISTP